MANGITFKMQGLDKVLKKIESYEKQLADDIDTELNVGVINIANHAKALAPRGKTGALAAAIQADTGARFKKAVRVPVRYAAWVEFGTGVFVFKNAAGFTFTPDMMNYAKEFYVSGKGRTPSRPFLFPAYVAEVPWLKERIKKKMFG